MVFYILIHMHFQSFILLLSFWALRQEKAKIVIKRLFKLGNECFLYFLTIKNSIDFIIETENSLDIFVLIRLQIFVDYIFWFPIRNNLKSIYS